MLKFLTNKLKNHSINDEPSIHVNPPNHHQFKDNEEHDSGTESDDEQQINLEELEEIVMENEVLDRSSASTTSPGLTICSVPSPYFLDSALASDSDINNDHHSSEEELEVINSSPKAPVQSRNASRCGNLSVNLRSASVNALPEKRKWSEINLTNLGSVGKLNRLCLTPGTRIDQSSGSSDDEVQGFLAANMGTPVKFRSSPPLDVVKPGKSLSPPPKLFHYEVSSRKRHRHMHKPHHLQRPCLDFEKMQQRLDELHKEDEEEVIRILLEVEECSGEKKRTRFQLLNDIRTHSCAATKKAAEGWRYWLKDRKTRDDDYLGIRQLFLECLKNVSKEDINGRSLADSQANGRNIQVRPKSEKFRAVTSANNSETSSTDFIQKNLDDYILSLSNFDLKQKLDSCPGNLVECPVLNDFREGLKKSISNHARLTSRAESRTCKTSRVFPTGKPRNETEVSKMQKQKSSLIEEQKASTKDIKPTPSTTSRGVIRSTRAQDLRSQSNRDLLKPKTTNEKTRTTSPYMTATPQKKKKNPNSTKLDGRSYRPSVIRSQEKKAQTGSQNRKNEAAEKNKKEKCASAGEEISLQRQKTQEIINPKIVKKTSSSHSVVDKGDFEPPQLKKSQTFFICKGAKNGEGDNKSKTGEDGNPQNDSPSDGNATDEDLSSPKPKPLTHNDSFCLIVKSSQNWSQRNRSDDEKWLHYGLAYEEKLKKPSDKGILKNSNHDLKSVDSVEKFESEKIVRFSDELLKNKKVLKKLVRRKKRLQNFFTPTWYQKNKLFQKYLQILREKSVLLSDQTNTPENLKPFRVPNHVKERYEAEMFGLFPRKSKLSKAQMKDYYSY